MAEIDPVILELRADLGKYRAELRSTTSQVERLFDRQGREAQRLERQMLRSSGAISGAFRGIAASLGLAGFGAAAKTYLDLADKSAKLTAQLKLATAQTGSFVQAQADVQRIASSTRSGLSETADLYALFQRNSRELGITQEDGARATETITKAFKISGATAAEAAGGLRQFMQGIQSGTLRGEELNSVLENAPRLAKALADGLNISIGQLREMGAAGELTGQKVMGALKDAATSIDSEFAQIPVTFGDAMTLVANAATITFGEFDRGGGFSEMLANFMTQGSDGFTSLGRDASDLAIDIRSDFAGLEDAFGPLLRGALAAFGDINSEAAKTGGNLRTLLGLIDKSSGWLSNQGVAGKLLTGGTVGDWWSGRQTEGSDLQGRFDAGKKRSAEQRRGKLAEDDYRMMIRDMRVDAFGNPLDEKPLPKSTAKPASTKKGPKGKSAETLRKEAEREAERAADNLRRFTDELASEQARLQTSLAELSRSVEARAAAELNEIEVSRAADARSIAADSSIDAAKQKELLAINEKNAAARANLVRQKLADEISERNLRIMQDRNDLDLEMLRHSGDMARTAKEAREVELRILDLVFESEKARLEQIKATNAATSAEWAYADARLKALPQLKANAEASAKQSTMGPLEQYMDRAKLDADELNEAFQGVAVDGLQSLNDGLTDAIMGSKNLGDMFKNVAKQIIADLIRIAIQQTIVNSLMGAVGGLFGGGSIATPGFGNLQGSIGGSSALHPLTNTFNRASGGYVAPGQTVRVNEHRGGAEYLRMGSQGGHVIPLGQVNQQAARPAAQGGGVVRLLIEEAPGFASTVRAEAQGVAIEVVKSAAPGIAQMGANEAQRAMNRPSMGRGF